MRSEFDNQILSVIVRFNDPARLPLLEESIFSLALQDWAPLEVLVMLQNGEAALEQDIGEIIEHQPWLFQPDVKILSVTIPPGVDGRANLLNQGIATARGRYLAFLDDDDYVYQHAYTTLISSLQKAQTQPALAVGGCRTAHMEYLNNHWYVKTKDRPFTWGRSKVDLCRGNFIPINSYVIDRQRVASEDLVFDSDFPLLEDYEFLLRLAVKYEFDFAQHHNAVCEYRIYSGNSVPYNESHTMSSAKSDKLEKASRQIERRKQELVFPLTVMEVGELVRQWLEEKEVLIQHWQTERETIIKYWQTELTTLTQHWQAEKAAMIQAHQAEHAASLAYAQQEQFTLTRQWEEERAALIAQRQEAQKALDAMMQTHQTEQATSLACAQQEQFTLTRQWEEERAALIAQRQEAQKALDASRLSLWHRLSNRWHQWLKGARE